MTAQDADIRRQEVRWWRADNALRYLFGDVEISSQVFFAGLLTIAFANAVADRAVATIREEGAAGAVMGTFGISLILWAALIVSLRLLLSGRRRPIRAGDIAVGGLSVALILIPVSAASSLAMLVLALHLGLTGGDRASRAAAAILFYLTIPLFWLRLVFLFAGDVILRCDASVVAAIVGVKADGNLIPFADGSGGLYLVPGCASLTNLSLALLSAAIFVHWRGAGWSVQNIAWTALSMAAVIAINFTRLSLLALFPAYYALLHGPVGAGLWGWLTLFAIVLIGYHRIGCDARRGI